MQVLKLSAKTGDGMDECLSFLTARLGEVRDEIELLADGTRLAGAPIVVPSTPIIVEAQPATAGNASTESPLGELSVTRKRSLPNANWRATGTAPTAKNQAGETAR